MRVVSSEPVSSATPANKLNDGSRQQLAGVESNVREHRDSGFATPDDRLGLVANIPALQLPTDHARPATLGSAMEGEGCDFECEFREGLRRLSAATVCDEATTALAVFSALLYRYTLQEKFAVGVSIAEQADFSSTTPITSVATTPVVVDLSGQPSFRVLVKRLEHAIRQGNELGSVSADLPERLGVEPDTSRHPVFQVAFSRGTNGGELTSPFAANGLLRAGFDLRFEFANLDFANGKGSGSVLRYNRQLFDRSTARRMLSHMRELMRGAFNDVEGSIAGLPMLTEPELHQQLVEWSGAPRQSSEKCLHQLVEEAAVKHPRAIAVRYGHEELTYSDLNVRANQLAHLLRKRGVGRNTRVGVCLPRSLDFAVAILATLKSGAACVPLDPGYPDERLSFMLADVAAPIVLTEPGLLRTSPPAGTELVFPSSQGKNLQQEPHSNPESGGSSADVAYVIYTSGSTGRPRGVLLTHAGLANYTLAAAELFGLRPGDRMLQFCSISFDAAVEEIFTTWASGAALVFRTEEISLEPGELIDWAEKEQITVMDLPTAYWHEWVYALPGLGQRIPRALRLVIVGGEKSSPEAFAAWHAAVGNRVRWMNTYGPAEASIVATAYEAKLEPGDTVPTVLPIGRPVGHARVYLLDPFLNPVPVGVAGEIHIGGIGVAQGYLNQPELTKEKFIPDIFSNDPSARLYKTGDMARYLANGGLDYVGRRDNQVKIRGFRIEPGEIESVLGKHPEVRDSAIIVHEDVPGDKRLAAYVVASEPRSVTAHHLRQHLRNRLPEYMVPPEFIFLERMPLTPNGKVNRRMLSTLPPQSASASAVNDRPVSDPLEAQLVKIWEELLGRRPVGVDENFFELGGHSLMAARLMHRIKQLRGKTVALATLLEAPTVAQLAAALRSDELTNPWSSLVAIQPEGLQPPFFCVHGVGGNVVGFHELARQMKPDHPFYGLQSQGLDGKQPCYTRIEDMAAHYLNDMRGVQPGGPYHLGGFSLGGLVAYEMACQLVAQGQEVALLVVFDTYAGYASDTANESSLSLLRHPGQIPRLVRRKLRRMFNGWMLPGNLKRVYRTNARAAMQYHLRPYGGKVTLVRATGTWRTSDAPYAGWSKLAGELETIPIACDHMEMLREPHVQELAASLRNCIDRTVAEPGVARV